MIDIEEFSLVCWSDNRISGPVSWNKRTGQGIIYRGYGRISDSERFFANELKRKRRVVEEGGRSITWGT